MTPEQELRMMQLEDAVHQAIWTIEFMHGCLTDEQYVYAYPEMTQQHLEKFRALAPPPKLCIHSVHQEDCSSCQAKRRRRTKMAQLKEQVDFQASLPEHLRDDAPYQVCSACGRKTGKDEWGRLCKMPQPDGTICTGIFRPSP